MDWYNFLTSSSYTRSSWRTTDGEGKQNMRWNKRKEVALTKSILVWDLEDYERGEFMVRKNKVRILVFGLSGHGKTSLLSSFTTALKKRVVHTGLCGERDEGVDKVVIKPAMKIDKQEVFFTFVDMPCLEDETDHALAHGEKRDEDTPLITEDYLKAAMQGNIEDGAVQLKEHKAPRKRSENYYNVQSYTNKICCAVVVIKSGQQLTDDIRKQLNLVFRAAADSKIQVHIVLTNIDVSHPDLKFPTYLKNVFWSKKIQKDVQDMSKQLWGIAENCIHPVLTYTSETESNTEMNVLLLYTLRNILNDATQHAETLIQDSLNR
ncbi:uncharacterized protein LOC121387608 [Gigantopelta aegis]|uniref:uncharacterized protein LOC121387608 n=1 Tax=Gigantopelta aegis TaxID=1735272 RepID=UPI001B889C53|nr:uncharacterized protein LOC121387608 [Gigantopelta aegis]